MSQQATLSEVLKAAVAAGLENVYTSLPGIIVTVKEEGKAQYVDVQPTLNIRDSTGQIVERPVILNVPLQQFSSDIGGVLVPVKVGTPCWLHFSMRGLDVWKRSNGRPSTPTDDRKFNRNDCYATVGVMPMQMSLQDQVKHTWTHDPNDVVLLHGIGTEQETEVRLHVSGGVTVNTRQGVIVNSQTVEVNASAATLNLQSTTWTGDVAQTGNYTMTGTLTVNGNIVSTGTISGAVVSAPSISANGVEMAAHVHPYTWTDPAGSGVTGPA